MATPCGTAISANDVNVELGVSGTTQLGLNDAGVRALAEKPSGAISYNDLRCKNKTWGSLWSWGHGGYGRLGHDDTTYRSSPVQVGTLTNWASVSGGSSYTTAIKTDGSLWSWGRNNLYGPLGLNDIINRSSPVQVGTLTNWASVSCGFYHTTAVKTDGSLWSWGLNDYGQLGHNNTIYRSSPVQVGTLTNWASASCGSLHTVAVKTDGSLWTWGHNLNGQLGLGNLIHRSSPVQVGTLTNWASVSGSRYYTTAVKTDGSLWSWGLNDYGQLGHGDGISRSSPVQVGTLTNWASVSGGSSYTTAIKTDGSLWSWGRNNLYGQLGLNDIINRSSPVQVGTLTNWVSVSCGFYHTTAVKTDGTLWSWGYGGDGHLGHNNTIYRSSPVQVGTLTNWASVPCGYHHTVAIKK